MAIYWLTVHDPDETAFFQVDWTDEMDAAGDTLKASPAPSFTAVDANVYGLTLGSIALASGNKKVNLYVSNSDPATNRVDVLANSPYLYTHEVATNGGQTLHRVVGIVVAERGSDLTVEDGSASASADTYRSLEAADLYHVNRGNTDWSGTDAERSRKLRRGTTYMDNRYLGRWKGTKATSGQALQWPRSGVTDEDGNVISSDAIPQKILDACCEAARAVPYTQKVSAEQSIKKVKAGSVEVEYEMGTQARELVNHLDEIVRPYLQASGRVTRGG
jgi:hypothetical protein